ncbi:MAG: DUF2911 domain-containing protein [Bacteroidota bacterium]
MKRIIGILGLLLTASYGSAQVQVPALSPEAEVEQTIGLSEVEIEYSRPSVRDREIFGSLLTYGELWRLGANKNTTISLSTEATIAGEAVAAGTYAVYARPDKKSWKIYLYSKTENWGVPDEWDESKVVATLEAEVQDVEQVESLTLGFEELTTKTCDFFIAWESSKIVLPMEFPTEKLTEESILATMQGEEINERDYYGAASYYLNAEKELKSALEYIKTAIEMRGEEAFWYLRKQALIEYKLGMKENAVKTAKRSLESAKKADNSRYVEMNQTSIEEWETE